MLKRPEDEKFQTLILFFFPYKFGKRFRFLAFQGQAVDVGSDSEGFINAHG